MNFKKRLRALEARLIMDPIILQFADGSAQALHGGRGFLVRLLRSVCGGADLASGQREHLELIRQSVQSTEPGGGRLIELILCLLHAQAEARVNG